MSYTLCMSFTLKTLHMLMLLPRDSFAIPCIYMNQTLPGISFHCTSGSDTRTTKHQFSNHTLGNLASQEQVGVDPEVSIRHTVNCKEHSVESKLARTLKY